MFKEHGRWLHLDETVYSELELKYLSSALQAMTTETIYEEFDRIEGSAIIEKHWEKTKFTLRKLMN